MIHAGQEVFVTYIHENKNPFHAIVDTVGKTYFTLKGVSYQFRKKDLEQKEQSYGHSQTYKIWLTKKEYNESEGLKALKRSIIQLIPLINRETADKIYSLLLL